MKTYHAHPLNAFGFGDFERDLNKVLENLFTPAPAKTQNAWRPRTDLVETEAAFTLKMDLPGLTKEDVSISLNDDVLTVKGERAATEKPEDARYTRFERFSCTFEQQFRFSHAIQADQIKATFENGVLTIELPKAETAKAIQISIN